MDNTLSIGLSALLAAQKNLDITGHNIANATTPNYSRQRVAMTPTPPGGTDRLATGAGVTMDQIQAIRDGFVDRLLLTQGPQAGAAARRAQSLSQVESLFSTDPEASLGAAIDRFFNSFRELSRNPSGAAERIAVATTASTLGACFEDLASRLEAMQQGLLPHVGEAVGHINQLTTQIAGLNLQIRDTVVTGGQANDLIDQRYTALRQLAELVPIAVTETGLSRVDVRCGGMALVSAQGAIPLTTHQEGGSVEVRIGDSDIAVQPATGQLGALLELAGVTIPGYLDRLDTLAATVIHEVNKRHATGVGQQGSFTTLSSTRELASADLPLARAGLPFGVAAGTLTVSIINETTGEVAQSQIAFDPSSQSLTDLAAALDGVEHLQASVSGGRLFLAAEGGYRFDFTNKVTTHPGTLGASTPTLQGAVSLEANDTYTLRVDTSRTPGGPGTMGTIGTTEGLRILVTNAAGATVATLDVGSSYQAGGALTLPGGITIAFDAADVTDGDALAVALAAEPDPQGLLAALGLNALLQGTGAADFDLEAAVAEDPGLIAAARSDAAADNTNALRLAELDELKLQALGDETIAGSCAQLIGTVGLDSQMAQRADESSQLMLEAAENQRDAVSGVNQDEEAIKLMQFQQLYMFAARYIKTIDELLDLLASI